MNIVVTSALTVILISSFITVTGLPVMNTSAIIKNYETCVIDAVKARSDCTGLISPGTTVEDQFRIVLAMIKCNNELKDKKKLCRENRRIGLARL